MSSHPPTPTIPPTPPTPPAAPKATAAIHAGPARPVEGGTPWERVRRSASATKYMATLLNELTCLGVAGGVARLVGPRDMVQAARAKAAEIEALFRQATGEPVKVQIEGMGGGGTAGATTAEVREAEAPGLAAEPAAPATPRAPMQEHPLVRQAIEQLGATFVRAQPRVRPPTEG